MDKLYNKQHELVQQISVEHTRKILGGSIGLMFYNVTSLKNGERLIVGYSEQRAKKDAHNREKGIERLRKAYSSGVLTKASINRRGYNKFLTISKDVQVVINEQEIENDKKWDGLKGYFTVDKGSVTVNGVSLTVCNPTSNTFQVAIIPYTFEHTNFCDIKVGTIVNLEFNILGKYIARLQQL